MKIIIWPSLHFWRQSWPPVLQNQTNFLRRRLRCACRPHGGKSWTNLYRVFSKTGWKQAIIAGRKFDWRD
ncbi:hypothetical protein [Collimonas sp.]|uniref:hypothetical protein n=1 Tax=Collimonas sp. TaxID=1963772 RepID=UPI002D80C0F2|nr:hypothetical protein [Collimonas sp.]